MKQGRGAGTNWFFIFTIPSELRGLPRFTTRNGKPMTKVTESLGTTDYSEARRRRDERIVYWDRQFRMLRNGPSEDDICEEAVEVYRAALKAEAARPYWGNTHLERAAEDYLRRLDSAIGTHVHREMRDYCKRAGVQLEPGTEPYRKIGIEFIKAKIAAHAWGVELPLPDGRWLRSSRGFGDLSGVDHPHLPPLPKIEPPVTSERQPPLPAPPLMRRETETFSEAFEVYLATELVGASKYAITDCRRKVKIFINKVGDLPLNKVTDHAAVDFLDNYLLGERKQKPITRNTYAMLFKAIFKCAIRRKKAIVNPFEDQRIKQKTIHYEPFTDQELATLFADAKFEISPAKHKTATALPWASLISAYTGCRLEEVARLKVEDIKKADDAIWYFEFCSDGNGKTEAAVRVVPLHHALIHAGLLRYREALPKDSMLFPGLRGRSSKPGRLGPKVGDAFYWWRKQLGIVREGVNFHSFRHTVGDRLRREGVQESDIAAVLGHEDERITSRVYGHNGPGLQRLQQVIERLSYKGLQISAP